MSLLISEMELLKAAKGLIAEVLVGIDSEVDVIKSVVAVVFISGGSV